MFNKYNNISIEELQEDMSKSIENIIDEIIEKKIILDIQKLLTV
jgi:hypothetical protein